jgi:hypothetical protein
MSSWRGVRVKSGRRPEGAAALLVALALAGCSAESPGAFTGTDTDRCKGVVCEAVDACHEPGECEPSTGKCTAPARPEGTSCDDDDACTVDDACAGGTCRGTPFVCKALNDCHNPGVCNSKARECTNPAKADGSACNDGNACTHLDACVRGQCEGSSPVVCQAQDGCHDPGECNAQTGECTNPAKADGAACEDGDPCTSADACLSGACARGTPVSCSPLDDCHDPGTCDSATGACTNPPKADGASCDDGNPCSTLDVCRAGACTGGTVLTCPASDACHEPALCNPATGQCQAAPRADGTTCDDGNACTRADACLNGACTGGNPVVCTATDDCHLAGACNIATGACTNPAKPNGSICNDGNACTRTDTCLSGACQGANPVVCTGTDQCHDGGTCNPASGLCSGPAKANGTRCSDGNACSQGDTCQSGSCVPGTAVTCAPSDQCHVVGTCDAATGACSNPVKAAGSPCNDGNACTRTDVCLLGVCIGGTPPNCASTDPCRVDGTCNPATGQCSSPPGPDGTFCTDGRECEAGLSACTGGYCVASGCFADPQDRCTLTAVDPKTGALVRRPRRCPALYLDPDTGTPNHCLELDTTVGALADPACNPSQTSCARTGCVPSTGVCEYRPRTCAPVDCHGYACEPSTGACMARPDANPTPCTCQAVGCASTPCVDVYCSPQGAAQNCDASSPVDCVALRPDTCHVVSASVPGGCDAATGCAFERVSCPAPPDGCTEYVQNPRPASTNAPCCELADRCARLSEVEAKTYSCSGGTCVEQ